MSNTRLGVMNMLLQALNASIAARSRKLRMPQLEFVSVCADISAACDYKLRSAAAIIRRLVHPPMIPVSPWRVALGFVRS
ncbi:hypothetical protein HaLaN_32633 [Haematococcus lacustris]|uniref:Uncharacterized protein n=1 Tax=Haematococcus lacustris TaxID=44745 RepID=A0A6A0ALB5_HAELA|nr:hypothetical protein HaLaN_32633 [Haematococcus lacustris]